MQRNVIALAVLSGLALLAGCDAGAAPGTARMLGNVDYDRAFSVSRAVLNRHFEIDTAEPMTGVITTRPQAAQDRPGGLIGLTPGQTRQVARLRVQRSGKQVLARLSIAVQSLGNPGVRRQVFGTGENYDSVPNQSPASVEAATTSDQNEQWTTRRYDAASEARILNEIYLQLNPAATQPTAPIVPTQPAK